jgi:hypothetical protein
MEAAWRFACRVDDEDKHRPLGSSWTERPETVISHGANAFLLTP